jgi:small subunit ribosomal protein S19e
MVSTYDANINETIAKVAEALKSKIKAPDWTEFTKTSAGKDRLPDEDDWYYKRAAAVLRTVYIRGPIGVNKLRVKFGSKKNRGHKPSKFYKAGGKVIRTILQQLEKSELIIQKTIKNHKGRVVTNKGMSFMDKNTVR